VLSFLAGNHDVGFQIENVAALTKRYERSFGPINQRVKIGHFELVMVSTASLEMKSWDERSYERTTQFLQSMKEANPSAGLRPRILITHVPLWRPQSATCGPLRHNSLQIPNSRGYSYKCLVREDITRTIINDVKPIYIFSGDDHDHCIVLHSSVEPTTSFFEHGSREAFHQWNTTFFSPHDQGFHQVSAQATGEATNVITVDMQHLQQEENLQSNFIREQPGKRMGILEQTVGTFSFLQGNLRPSFALLTLKSSQCYEPSNEGDQVACTVHQLATGICSLPPQLLIYACYAALALVSVLALLAYHLNRAPSLSQLVQLSKPSDTWWHGFLQEFMVLLGTSLLMHLLLFF